MHLPALRKYWEGFAIWMMTRTSRFPAHHRDTVGLEIDALIIEVVTGFVDGCDDRSCQLDKLGLLLRLAKGLRLLTAEEIAHAHLVLRTTEAMIHRREMSRFPGDWA